MKWKTLKKWNTKVGLPAITLVNDIGIINGYVGIDKNHKYYEDNYDKHYDIDVHGGLTYSRKGDGSYLPKDYWWFGFDTNHAGDACNYKFGEKLLFPIMTNKEKKQHNLVKEIHLQYPIYDEDIWRDEKYVENECEKLAKQLKEA